MEKMKKNKAIPKFKNEDEEREFWEKNDTSEYFDFANAKIALFPNLKPSTQAISIRLPVSMIESLKTIANSKDVPYQSLIKIYLAERIKSEFGR